MPLKYDCNELQSDVRIGNGNSLFRYRRGHLEGSKAQKKLLDV